MSSSDEGVTDFTGPKGEGDEAHDVVRYSSEVDSLAEEHRSYLLQRHGTLQLDPVPHMDDGDALNWPRRKKMINLALVCFHSAMFGFTAASIQCAFVDIAADLHVSVQRTSYLVSLFIAILGGAPLFWRPLAHSYGRRPIFLISIAGTLIGNVGCGASHSFATMAVCRAVAAFFVSPAGSLGGAVVSEMFFRRERGRYMGVWMMMVMVGVPVAPLIFGFVAQRVGYRWIYWVLAMANGVHLVVYFVLGAESRFEPGAAARRRAPFGGFLGRRLAFGRISPQRPGWLDFVRPFKLALSACVAVAAVVQAMVFLWGNIMVTLETPQIFPDKFGLDTQQVGLQNVAIIIGTLLGEQLGGFVSDRWMMRRERRSGKPPMPEFRLWLGYPAFALTICGVVVYFVQLHKASDSWNVTPLVGSAIASAGNQIVSAVFITYAIDCYPHQADCVAVFVNFVRQTWGFIGPFWFPQMIEQIGFDKSAIVATAMIVAVSILPTIVLQCKGHTWRQNCTISMQS